MRSEPQKLERDISLDFIRLVATFLVICLHVSANGFYYLNQYHWWAANIYESIARVAVPLFFMVTGALLLPKEITIRSILARLWRITVPLLAWSMLYLKYQGVNPDFWMMKILKAPVMYHLWYLYTLFGAYLFLPVMAGFFQANHLKTLLFVIAAWFLGATIVPTTWSLTSASAEYASVSWEFLSLYAGYMVLGAILYKKIMLRKSYQLATAPIWGACIAAIAYLTWTHSIQLGRPDSTFYEYKSPFVALCSAAAFISLREFSQNYLSQNKLALVALPRFSRLCFGIYLVHAMILDVFYLHSFNFKFINPWAAIPIVTVVTFAVSALLVAILQKLPVIRSIVPA